jgi:hypothetical protein
MDPLSVGLGVASLVVVPGELFKQCVVAYRLFIDGKNLEKPMFQFGTLLEIQYHRFVHWGEVCGLSTAPSPHMVGAASQLFQDPKHAALVKKLLSLIKGIFEDATSLTQKYGIFFLDSELVSVEVDPQASQPDMTRSTLTEAGDDARPLKLSTSLMVKKLGLKSLQSDVVMKAKSGAGRLRWAVKDKKGFEKLLEDLGQFNQGLYDLHAPDIHKALIRDTIASLIEQSEGPCEILAGWEVDTIPNMSLYP